MVLSVSTHIMDALDVLATAAASLERDTSTIHHSTPRSGWDEVEVAALMHAVSVHGTQWESMLNDPNYKHAFAGRTVFSLKSKWGRLTRGAAFNSLHNINPVSSTAAILTLPQMKSIQQNHSFPVSPKRPADEHTVVHAEGGNWDANEVKSLHRGVAKHGTDWNSILKDPEFSSIFTGRTCYSLKSKWNRIKHQHQTPPSSLSQTTPVQHSMLPAAENPAPLHHAPQGYCPYPCCVPDNRPPGFYHPYMHRVCDAVLQDGKVVQIVMAQAIETTLCADQMGYPGFYPHSAMMVPPSAVSSSENTSNSIEAEALKEEDLHEEEQLMSSESVLSSNELEDSEDAECFPSSEGSSNKTSSVCSLLQIADAASLQDVVDCISKDSRTDSRIIARKRVRAPALGLTVDDEHEQKKKIKA